MATMGPSQSFLSFFSRLDSGICSNLTCREIHDHRCTVAIDIQDSAGRRNAEQKSCEVALKPEKRCAVKLLYVLWKQLCIYTCVQCGYNVSPLTLGSSLADQITVCPHVY